MSEVRPFVEHKPIRKKRVLDAGSGGGGYDFIYVAEDLVKLDINPKVNPDVVGDMRKVDQLDIGKFDAVVSIHALEHLYPFEVVDTLKAFRNVLNDGGVTVICVPDLEDVRPTTEVLYNAEAGPICGLDMFYGLSRAIQQSPEMAHHCGFTETLLRDAIDLAGYSSSDVRRYSGYNLIAIGVK